MNLNNIIFKNTGKFANIFSFILKLIEKNEDIFYSEPTVDESTKIE